MSDEGIRRAKREEEAALEKSFRSKRGTPAKYGAREQEVN